MAKNHENKSVKASLAGLENEASQKHGGEPISVALRDNKIITFKSVMDIDGIEFAAIQQSQEEGDMLSVLRLTLSEEDFDALVEAKPTLGGLIELTRLVTESLSGVFGDPKSDD